MDCSPPDSSVHGISQARILEWVAIAFSGDLPNPEIKPRCPALAGGFFTTEPHGKPSVGDVSLKKKKKDISDPKWNQLSLGQQTKTLL